MAAATIRELEGIEKESNVLRAIVRLANVLRAAEEAREEFEIRVMHEFGKVSAAIERFEQQRSPLDGRSETTKITMLQLLEQHDMMKDANFMRSLRKGGWGIFWKVVGAGALAVAALLVAALWSQVKR